MTFGRDLLDRIRDRVILSDVIGERVLLKQKGQYHVGLCPFHLEKSPSFTVTNAKGIFHCFGCGAQGSVFDFLMKMQGLSFPEAVKEVATRAGIDLPIISQSPEAQEQEAEHKAIYAALGMAQDFFHKNLLTDGRASGAREYIEKRGIPGPDRDRFCLGFSPKGRPLTDFLLSQGVGLDVMQKAGLVLQNQDTSTLKDRFGGRLMFPIHDKKGRVIGFGARALGDEMPKYLNSPTTPVFHKGQCLYGIWEVIKNKKDLKDAPLVVAEGYLDVIALWRVGIAALAPLGTALTPEQIQMIWGYCPDPVLCFDGDGAGRQAALKALERGLDILKPGLTLRFAFMPQSQDPDTLCQTVEGIETLKKRVFNPKSLVDTLWFFYTTMQRLDTPDEQAMLKKRLQQAWEKIQDPDLRAAYRGDLMKRYNQMFFSPDIQRIPKRAYGSPRQYKPSLPTAPSSFGNEGSQMGGHRQQEILLLIFYFYPALFEEKFETFLRLEPNNEKNRQLKEILLQHAERGLSTDTQTLLQELKAHHLMPAFLGFDAKVPLDQMRKIWEEIWTLSEGRKSMQEEATLLKNTLVRQSTQANWQQLKAFQKIYSQTVTKDSFQVDDF